MTKQLTPFVAALGAALVVGLGFSLISGFDSAALMVATAAGIVVFVLAYNLSGNRAIANADEATRRRALGFELWPDKTALYLVRTGFVGMAAGMNIAIDGKPVAQLKSPRFTRLDIAPGPHAVTASFGGGLAGQTKAADFQFNGAPSEVVVLRLSVGLGALKNPLKIERVSMESVQSELPRLQMAAADIREI
jgi:hypothetical protein